MQQDAVIREHLSNILSEEEDYAAAAQTLAGVNMESGGRQYSDADKAAKYIRIAELYLEVRFSPYTCAPELTTEA